MRRRWRSARWARMPAVVAVAAAVVATVVVALVPPGRPAAARSGLVHEYRVSAGAGTVGRITAGPDGRMWFSGGALTVAGEVSYWGTPIGVLDLTPAPGGGLWAIAGNSYEQVIYRLSTDGTIEAEYPLPDYYGVQDAYRLAVGPDGNVWYARHPAVIGRMTPTGAFTEFPLPDGAFPGQRTVDGIVAGGDGALWFTMNDGLGRITTSGEMTFDPNTSGRGTVAPEAGPDGSIWFVVYGQGWEGNDFGRLSPSGALSLYDVPQSVGEIELTPEGDVWFVSHEGVGTMTAAGQVIDRGLSGAHIARGPDGHMWVSRADGDSTVLEFDRSPDPTGEFTPVTPQRILDTRTGTGTGGVSRPIPSDSSIRVAATGVGGVPTSGVSAVVLNATVTEPTDAGYLTVWPAGGTRPVVSNLNFVPGQTVPNLVTVAVGAGGALDVYNPVGTTHVVFDVVGFYASGSGPVGARFEAVAPSRLFDTRTGTGGVPAVPLGPAGTVRVQVPGRAGVPATGVSAVVMNVTVTQPTGAGYVTVYPGDVARPLASSLNFVPGQTVANLVTVRLPANGTVELFNAVGSTHLLADVVGYYTVDTMTGAGRFVPVPPERLIDTREDEYPFGAMREVFSLWDYYPQMDYQGASAAVLNVTATEPSTASYVTVYPNDVCPTPLASNLNFMPGQTVPNLVITGLSVQPKCDLSGPWSFTIFNAAGEVDIVVDIFGYFTVADDTVP